MIMGATSSGDVGRAWSQQRAVGGARRLDPTHHVLPQPPTTYLLSMIQSWDGMGIHVIFWCGTESF